MSNVIFDTPSSHQQNIVVEKQENNQNPGSDFQLSQTTIYVLVTICISLSIFAAVIVWVALRQTGKMGPASSVAGPRGPPGDVTLSAPNQPSPFAPLIPAISSLTPAISSLTPAMYPFTPSNRPLEPIITKPPCSKHVENNQCQRKTVSFSENH